MALSGGQETQRERVSERVRDGNRRREEVRRVNRAIDGEEEKEKQAEEDKRERV